MTLTELRYIVTLAQEQHFGRAAERCFVAQPTLSVAVKKLEDERLTLISNKNSEIQKLTEENKNHYDSIKTKEAAIRKNTQDLEICRSHSNKI